MRKVDEFVIFSQESLGCAWQIKEESRYFPGFCPEPTGCMVFHSLMQRTSMDVMGECIGGRVEKTQSYEAFKWDIKSEKMEISLPHKH